MDLIPVPRYAPRLTLRCGHGNDNRHWALAWSQFLRENGTIPANGIACWRCRTVEPVTALWDPHGN